MGSAMDVNELSQAELAQDCAYWAHRLRPLVEATNAPSNESTPMVQPAEPAQPQENIIWDVNLLGGELASTPTEVPSITQVDQPQQSLEPQNLLGAQDFLEPQQTLLPQQPLEHQQEDWTNQLAIDMGFDPSSQQLFGISEWLQRDPKRTAGLSCEMGNMIGAGAGASIAHVKNTMTQLNQEVATTLAQRQAEEQYKVGIEALKKETQELEAKRAEGIAVLNKLKEDCEKVRSVIAALETRKQVALQTVLAQQSQQPQQFFFNPQVLQAQEGSVWPQQQQQEWNSQMFYQPQQFLNQQQFLPQQQSAVQTFDYGMLPAEQPATINSIAEFDMSQVTQPQPQQSAATPAQQPSAKRQQAETKEQQTDKPVRGYRKHRKPRAPRPDYSKRRLEYEDA